MGYNTTVIVLNDALDAIRNDPEFGKNLAEAVLKLSLGRHKEPGIDVPAYSYVDGEKRGVHCNAATAVESHHADMKSLIAVGGNCAIQLGNLMFGNPTTVEGRIALLKQLASDLGYEIRRKAQR